MITVDIRALLDRMNDACTQAVEAAAGAALSRAHYEVTIEQVLAKLLETPTNDLGLILQHYSVDSAVWNRTIESVLEEASTGNSGKPVFSPLLLEWLEEAWLISSVDFGQTSIRSGTLLLALLAKPERFVDRPVYERLRSLIKEAIRPQFLNLVKGSIETPKHSAASKTESRSAPGTALEKFCTDFTRKADLGQVDPVFGRDREIYQMIDILTRRRKNNPILVGEAGVGKTAVVEGLALRIVQGHVPDALKGISILGLDMGLLQAGAGVQGEFEHRLKSVIQEIKASAQPIILFIDEAHTLIGAGGPAGGSDAANLLKPALARGELRTIAATTWSEYKKYFEKDPALARRFQPVKLDEPSVEETILILRGLKSRYEEAHGVTVRDSALVAAVEYSSRYITGRQLPDKAVDLLDTSAARVKGLLTARPAQIEDRERQVESLLREQKGIERDALHGEISPNDRLPEIKTRMVFLQEEIARLSARWEKEKELAHQLIYSRQMLLNASERKEAPEKISDYKQQVESVALELKALQMGTPLVPTEVDPDIVAQVVSDWTGIPLGKVLRDEAENMTQLSEHLSKRIRGQENAVAQISQILNAAKVGLKDPEQPLGVFLLVGPSGVGKTETALAVADLLFGGERFLTTINMSEFHEGHTISRLIGSPPGYVGYGEGGLLTEAVRQKPYSVVLLDEVEKGHLDVMNLFYQVFDKGHLSDGEGRSIDFKNTVLFLTSNLASDMILHLCKDGAPRVEQVLEAIRPTLSKHFKPALLARMTVVPYFPLEQKVLKEIVALKLERLAARVFDTHKIKLVYSEVVLDQISALCQTVDSGARHIDHLLNSKLLPQLSRDIVSAMGKNQMPKEIRLEPESCPSSF